MEFEQLTNLFENKEQRLNLAVNSKSFYDVVNIVLVGMVPVENGDIESQEFIFFSQT